MKGREPFSEGSDHRHGNNSGVFRGVSGSELAILSNEELEPLFAREFDALCRSGKVVRLRLSAVQAWAVLGMIQLALSHPKNNGRMAKIARNVAMLLEATVAMTPALAEVARRGWRREAEQDESDDGGLRDDV